MTDIHIGEILDVLDAYDMWKDTMVIFTTDHGFHLGEHGYMAKNYMAPYNEVFHIPLIICKPGCGAARSQALTQNIDVMPTMLEYFGADQRLHYPLHGKSLMPVLTGTPDRSEAGSSLDILENRLAIRTGPTCTSGRQKMKETGRSMSIRLCRVS